MTNGSRECTAHGLWAISDLAEHDQVAAGILEGDHGDVAGRSRSAGPDERTREGDREQVQTACAGKGLLRVVTRPVPGLGHAGRGVDEEVG